MAFLKDGSFLVSDGYCNARVARFKPDGSHVGDYVKPSSAGAAMGIVHSVVVAECDGQLLVADRQGKHVNVFNIETREFVGGCNAALLVVLLPLLCIPLSPYMFKGRSQEVG